MKMLVISYHFEEDGEDVSVPLNSVSDIDFDDDNDFPVTVTLDNGNTYDCDYVRIEKC